jgi:dihydrolipoamide dehydrogenase
VKIVIIGSGPGGYVAAIKAARLGADVTVIEDTEVGGTCLNRGCIPTKSIIASTELLSKTKKLDSYGLELNGTITPNLEKIIARKDKIVDTQVKGIRALFKSWGIKLIEGHGRLQSNSSVEATLADGTTKVLEADKVILATGSNPAKIPTFPFDGERILTSDDALRLTEIPESIFIVGAGVIGCEWAFIFKDLGAQVTIVDMLPRALSTEDTEMSDIIAREFKKKKIKFITGTSVDKVEVASDCIISRLMNDSEITAEKVLVSIGRTYNTAGLGIDEIGIKTGQRGEILIDSKMQTNIENVYAIGDVTGGLLLAHKASAEGIVAAKNANGIDATMDYSCVPAAIFTTPEIASVGIRDFEAHEQGIDINTGIFQYRSLGKAHALGEITGIFKIIADGHTDKVLGVHIAGANAADIIHEGALAIRNGLTSRDIASTIHAHPTLSEGLFEAAEDVHDNAIHVPKKK